VEDSLLVRHFRERIAYNDAIRSEGLYEEHSYILTGGKLRETARYSPIVLLTALVVPDGYRSQAWRSENNAVANRDNVSTSTERQASELFTERYYTCPLMI
jgi:hypothetical protein